MNKVILPTRTFPVSPSHIDTSKHFWDAFGNTETEASARYVVLLCQRLGKWGGFTKEEIEAYYNEAGFVGFRFNRLLSEETHLFSPANPAEVAGWVVLGEDKKYYVTDDFILRCFKASPKEV